MSEDWQVIEATRETQLWASRWHDGQTTGLYSLSSTGVFWASKMEDIYQEYQDILDLDYGEIPSEVADEIESTYELFCAEEGGEADYDELDDRRIPRNYWGERE